MGCENMIPTGCTGKSLLTVQAPSHPLKEGRLRMVQRVNDNILSTPITLKVYGSAYGMYAVVGQDRITCKECGFINLKNCLFQKNPSLSKQSGGKEYGFEIIQTKMDIVPLTFIVSNKSELDEWESVFASQNYQDNFALREQHRTPLAPLGQTNRLRTLSEPPLLPALEEGDEE